MAIDGSYLSARLSHSCIPALRAYGDCFRQYFLPVFDDLSAKAEAVAAAEHDRLLSEASGLTEDLEHASISAQEKGQSFYDTMFAFRQASLNIFLAGVYHLLEQQLALLGEDATFQAMGIPVPETKLGDLTKWYARYLGLELTSLSHWPLVDGELRLIANAVKHGEGSSAEQLRRIRPELFVDPRIRLFGLELESPQKRLSNPMGGDDMYVTPELFDEYSRATVGLLEEVRAHFVADQRQQYPK